MTVVAWKGIGAVIAAASIGAVGVLVSGRAPAKSADSVAQPTYSAPALTSADLVGVRDELRQLRIDTSKDIADVRDEVRALRKEVHEARK